MQLVAGIDEAGRGPMIGPMVMVLAGIDEKKYSVLADLGVKDSKLLSPTGREKLRKKLLEVLDIVVIRIISPEEIDSAVWGKRYTNLNQLELVVMVELIKEALKKKKLEKVFVDSPDPKPERFQEKIRDLLSSYRVEVVADNDADKKYPIVSAASIIAKTERDRIIERLKLEYGDFGSGYPSDPRTRQFAKEWLRRQGEPPPIARKSWKSWKKLLSEIKQRQLF
ncbi:MAG: ribonuclease HII [Thermoprotei archaeon]|nr:MAG: ribonuclease HII [Thermoprotei archaeon]